jgi:hypothetical protein
MCITASLDHESFDKGKGSGEADFALMVMINGAARWVADLRREVATRREFCTVIDGFAYLLYWEGWECSSGNESLIQLP